VLLAGAALCEFGALPLGDEFLRRHDWQCGGVRTDECDS
jgi:hypothetical protein